MLSIYELWTVYVHFTYSYHGYVTLCELCYVKTTILNEQQCYHLTACYAVQQVSHYAMGILTNCFNDIINSIEKNWIQKLQIFYKLPQQVSAFYFLVISTLICCQYQRTSADLYIIIYSEAHESQNNCLVIFRTLVRKKSNPFAEVDSVYSPVPEDWAFGLVWFHGISNIVGYLMPNSFLHI